MIYLVANEPNLTLVLYIKYLYENHNKLLILVLILVTELWKRYTAKRWTRKHNGTLKPLKLKRLRETYSYLT